MTPEELKKRLDKMREEHDKLLASLPELPPDEAESRLSSLEESYETAQKPFEPEIDDTPPAEPEPLPEPPEIELDDTTLEPPLLRDEGPPRQHIPEPPPVEFVEDQDDSGVADTIQAEIPVRGPQKAPESFSAPRVQKSPVSPLGPESVSEASRQATPQPLPIPPRIGDGGPHEVDADWTPETAKGLDLSDGESLLTGEEPEVSPSGEMDSVTDGMQRYVTMQNQINRQMQEILIEAVADLEDLAARFDRLR